MRTRQPTSTPLWLRPVVFSHRIAAAYVRHFTIQEYNQQLFDNPAVVLSLLLAGTAAFMEVVIALLLISFGAFGNTHILGRIFIAVCLLGWVYAARSVLRRGNVKPAGIMVLALYIFIATTTVVLWSITAPFGLLMFGFVIVIAGIILGPRFTLPFAVMSIGILLVVQVATHNGILISDRSSVVLDPNILDVAGFGILFMVIALASWISGRQMERSLERALAAEHQLQVEKALLATRLEARTRKLQALQLKEMQQLYRFAELGQLSTALLHDLANHLTVLTLDIEDIHKQQHSKALMRAKNSIYYLDNLVEHVRDQLRGDTHAKPLNVIKKIQETKHQLRDTAKKHGVTFTLEYTEDILQYVCFGDPTRFRQILTILISNSIDAYKATKRKLPAVVKIEAELTTTAVVVRITDWGIGISPDEAKKLFKPFHSTKADGMGIGLFIARQMVTTHFKGTVELEASRGRTTFVVSVPLYKESSKLNLPASKSPKEIA